MRFPSWISKGWTVAFLGLCLTASAADDRLRVSEQAFKVKPGSGLHINAATGSITVEGGEVDEVRLEVRAKAVKGSDAQARELLDSHVVEMTEKDGKVVLETRLPRRDRWWSAGPNLQVEIRATVPRRFQLDVATSGGSIHVSRIAGTVAARTAGGSLKFDEIDGALNGRTSGGSIKAAKLLGPVELQTSGGSIALDGVSGDRVNASTSGGSITASGLGCPATLKTSGGSIRIRSDGHPVDATTSGGSIDAEFATSPKGDVVLRTSGGSVNVMLPEKAAVNLDAATSAGSVRNEFSEPAAPKDKNRSVLRGAIGGGGPELKLRTSAGGIQIRKS